VNIVMVISFWYWICDWSLDRLGFGHILFLRLMVAVLCLSRVTA